MLVTVLIWLYTLLILAGWGLGVSRGLSRWLRVDILPALPLVLLAGLAAVTSAAALISLFAPTGLLTNVVLLAGALAGIWAGRSVWIRRERPAGWSPLVLLLTAVTLAAVLNAATLKTANPDTGIYHAQAVRWIETYPAVPGLGNFHTRLAYNSNWLVATAAFSLSFLKVQSFHLTGSVLFLIAVLYFVTGLNDLLRGRVTPASILKIFFFPLATYLLAGDISSPTPDLAATLLVWACFVLYIETVFSEQLDRVKMNGMLLGVLAAFAVTVKLSTLPVLLLPVLRLVHTDRRQGVKMLAAAGVVLLPWLARNLIVSGYPVFPGLALDLFHFDWRIPAETVQAERLGIASYARVPRLPGSEVQAMPLRDWSKLWFNNLTLNRQAAFLMALFSPVLVGLTLLAGRVFRRTGNLWQGTLRTALAWAAAWVGVLFWFFVAPAVRFGYGFLAAAPMLAVLPLLSAGASRLGGCWLFRVGVITALALTAYQGITLVQSLDARTLPARLVLPADYTNLPTEPCKTDHLSAFCPSQWQECGYEMFPCTPSLNPNVVRRGKDWSAGFRSLEVAP